MQMKEKHQCFSTLYVSFYEKVPTNKITLSKDKNGPKNGQFTWKSTFHEKYIPVIFFYSDSLAFLIYSDSLAIFDFNQINQIVPKIGLKDLIWGLKLPTLGQIRNTNMKLSNLSI